MLYITPWERAALELLACRTTAIDMTTRLGVSEPEMQCGLARCSREWA